MKPDDDEELGAAIARHPAYIHAARQLVEDTQTWLHHRNDIEDGKR